MNASRRLEKTAGVKKNELHNARNVGRAQALRPLLANKLDRFALIQRFVSVGLNRGKMHEHIFAARALDKTKTLGTVKPLHNTLFFHRYSPCFAEDQPEAANAFAHWVKRKKRGKRREPPLRARTVRSGQLDLNSRQN
jgi:hypothetical protein